MSSGGKAWCPAEEERPPFLVKLLLGATLATSGVLMFEPSPSDLLFLPTAFVVLLTSRSLSPLPLGLGALGGVLLFAIANLVSLLLARDMRHALVFMGITFYLFTLAFLVAGLVARYQSRILRPMFLAFSVAAVVCAGIGLLARFDLVPNPEVFFRDESGTRVKSTFKDPNVFGPFLVLAVLWTLAFVLEQRRWVLPALMALAVYLLGILFTLSRGAYIHLIISVTTFILLHLFVVRDPRVLRRLSVAGCLALAAFPLLLTFALTKASLDDDFSERLSLQSYDQERFGTHLVALESALESPLGIGPGEWRKPRFAQATHNLYLRVLVENGWLGGLGLLVFLGSVLLTCLRVVLERGPHAGLQAAFLAVLVGMLIESFVIDTLHWRHLFLTVGMAMGLGLCERRPLGSGEELAETGDAAHAGRHTDPGHEIRPVPGR